MTPMRLYINVDHVATLREARKTDEPDPVEAALLCEQAGADGITAHLREDRRHIQDTDVERLASTVRVFNLELATSPDVVAMACRLRPYQATPAFRLGLWAEYSQTIRPPQQKPVTPSFSEFPLPDFFAQATAASRSDMT